MCQPLGNKDLAEKRLSRLEIRGQIKNRQLERLPTACFRKEEITLLGCPKDVGNYFIAIAKISNKDGNFAVITDFFSPILDSMHVCIREACRHVTHGGCVVKMRIDGY